MRRWGGPARVAIATVAVAGTLLLFVFPTRTYLGQRADIDRTRSQIETLIEENERLRAEAARLRDPAEIERIARERFFLVRPGEQAFAVVPVAPDAEGDVRTDAG